VEDNLKMKINFFYIFILFLIFSILLISSIAIYQKTIMLSMESDLCYSLSTNRVFAEYFSSVYGDQLDMEKFYDSLNKMENRYWMGCEK